jgi:hypothetical protein
MHRCSLPLASIGLALAMPFFVGCTTTVYQPLAALERPIIIDTARPNFKGVAIQLECLATDSIPAASASRLCGIVSRHLENQEAMVTVVRKGDEAIAEEERPEERPEASSAQKDKSAPIRLQVRLSARRLDESKRTPWWYFPLFAFSFTAYPLVSQIVDEQRIEVRDASGFLISDTTTQSRFIQYTGVVYWGINSLNNWLFREKTEAINDANMRKQVTRDYLGTLSQTVLNASERVAVLELARKTGESR